MSKERQHRRAEREREAAMRAAARQRESERKAKSRARRQLLTRLVPRARLQPGIIARRGRAELGATFLLLFILNVLVWMFVDGWAARFGAIVVSLLVFPVVRLMIAKR
jgi:hypothetical protein